MQEIAKAAVAEYEQKQAAQAAVKKGQKTMQGAEEELKKAKKKRGLSI